MRKHLPAPQHSMMRQSSRSQLIDGIDVCIYDDIHHVLQWILRTMKVQLAKWGNSLAVRLPVDYLRVAGLKAGDTLDAQVDAAGNITLTPESPFNKSGVLDKVMRLHRDMPVTEPVVESMRDQARY